MNKLLSILTREQLIQEFHNLGNAMRIAEKYELQPSTVYNAFEVIGFDCKIRADAKSILTKELLEKEYAELQSFRKVGKKLGVSNETVRRYMQVFNLHYNEPVLYSVDHDFFERENEQAFYLAGFIAADGCVKKRPGSSRCLYIGLAQRDKEFLQQILSVLKSNAKIDDYLIKNSKNNPKHKDSYCSSFTITSKQIFDDLARFNVVPAKTKTYTFPEWLIDHPLVHHFMRGYNDGDGSFYVPKLNNYDDCNRTVKQVFFTLRGTYSFLLTFRSILERNNLVKARTTPIRNSSGWGCLEYGGNGVLAKICQFLYKDATIFLPRKKAIIEHLLL